MTLGDFIKQKRNELNVTMDEVAKKTGLSKGYISMLENNKNPRTGRPIVPSFESMKLVANAFNININELIKILDDSQPVELGINKTDSSKIQYDQLFDKYKSLNNLGKQKANDYINDLADNPKYTAQEPKPLRLHTKHDTAPQTFVNEDGEEMVILPVVARGGNSKPVIMTKKAYEEANKEFAELWEDNNDNEIIPLDED